MRGFNLAIIFLITFITSCKPAETEFRATENFSTINNWNDPNPALTSEINTFLQSKMNNIPTCTEENVKNHPNCRLEKIEAGTAEPLPSSKGYRVMLIDSQGMMLAAYTRYRNRVLENLFEDEKTGEYNARPPALYIPQAAKEILLDSFQNPAYEKIPSELLTPSLDTFIEKFPFLNSSTGHGVIIFNYIANNSPNSQFVLVHENDSKFNSILCGNDSEDNKIKEISKLFDRQANSILSKIKQYDINFISYSQGYSARTLRQILQNNRCREVSTKLITNINKVYFEYFLKPLTTKSKALLVQANSGSDYLIKSKHDKDFYSDCQELTNRVRVGTANILEQPLPFEGSKNIEYLNEYEKNAKLCTDLYINFAVEIKRPFRYNKGVIHFSKYNIGAYPTSGTAISPSFATPVAVSYLINLKMQLKNDYPNNELSNNMLLKKLYENNNFIFDPSLHKQLPIYELQLLK
ncbi:hypothetical protein [Fluviispira multicolorata]|uniref:Lipoprotein n=1 Tax=Fluviispira multicolorata TaxID=2654512 RepID=A0A833JE81_9BACT|nr:hypothetical protein [Fluviispira multicolorata]KAB8032270.1 hypothetical protein GCL57_06370 [Fluviispira multicolorata]